MNFRKISEVGWGGGVIFDLKNFIANLVRFGPVCENNCNIFSEKGAGGGGSKAVGKFSENSSVLASAGFPNNSAKMLTH